MRKLTKLSSLFLLRALCVLCGSKKQFPKLYEIPAFAGMTVGEEWTDVWFWLCLSVTSVMTGLDPVIHDLPTLQSWIRGASPRMTI